jgi:hypothetical protein
MHEQGDLSVISSHRPVDHVEFLGLGIKTQDPTHLVGKLQKIQHAGYEYHRVLRRK